MCNCSSSSCSGNCSISLPIGPQGLRGMSTYETWLAQGNTGSESDFIDSLKGDKGDQGDPGEDTTSTLVLSKFTRAFNIFGTEEPEDPDKILSDPTNSFYNVDASDLVAAGITDSPLECCITLLYKLRSSDPYRLITPITGNTAHDADNDPIVDVQVSDTGISFEFNSTGTYRITVIG